MSEHEFCPTCICGRRAPVQGDSLYSQSPKTGTNGIRRGPGTISWAEHVLAWNGYAAENGTQQTAERMAERGGFDYYELRLFLGRDPETWEPTR